MYSEILQEIMAKCVELGSSNIIVGGDMNTNLQRVNSDFTRQLKLLCEVDSFTPCIDFVDSKIKYTFTSPVDHGTHTIDHLLVNDGLFNSVLEYYSLHEGTNLSFHSPIIFTLHINVEYSSCHTTTNIPKPKWQESTNHDLRASMRTRLIRHCAKYKYHGRHYSVVINRVQCIIVNCNYSMTL